MIYEFNTEDFKTPPFQHQIVGVKFLLQRAVGAIFDEMGSGKSKQFIDTSCILYKHGSIDTVLIVAPASVKTTWKDAEEGEIVKHCFVPFLTQEYHSRTPTLRFAQNKLNFIVTNYEFIRSEPRLTNLINQIRGRKTMVVFDESSYIKSHRAAQTKAAKTLREVCVRAYLSNGSPINNNLVDLYAPFAVIDKRIIGAPNYWAFRGRYCVLGGYQNKQIIGHRNVEELQNKLKPYVLRRLKEDCLDLPPKLYNLMEVPLSNETWRIYKDLRDKMVAWLDEQTPVVTMHTIVKLVRLDQICSGMVGGLDRSREFTGTSTETDVEDLFIDTDVQVISHEKHQAIVDWLKDRIAEVPNFRCIFWTRFRKEQELLKQLLTEQTAVKILRIYGGQNKVEREEVIREFNRGATQPVVLLGQPKAGGMGLNLQAECNWAAYVSNDYSMLTRSQSEDRIHRSGQRASTVNYLDVLATGPDGQKTINHAIRKTLRNKDLFATQTTAYWRAILQEE